MSGGVGSASHSVVGVLISAPEPELETVDSSDHLHKIDREVPWSEDSIQSSTSDQECWESVPGTWHKCQVETEKSTVQHVMHPHYRANKVPLLRPNGRDSSQPCGRLKQSTPELHAQLNLTNDKKRKITIPASMACAWEILMLHLLTKLSCPSSIVEKRRLSRLKAATDGQAVSLKKWKPHSGQLFNQTTSTG